MPVVTRRAESWKVFAEAAGKGICLPVFAAEDRETLEAILSAGAELAEETGRRDLPVIVTWTVRYPLRPQMTKVLGCGDPSLGLQLMLSDLRILMREGSPYHDLMVLPHLDHFVPWMDAPLLEGYWDGFASVLVDASEKPDAENIAITRDYVQQFKGRLVVEGVVSGIGESGCTDAHASKTTVENAKAFRDLTGVDLIAPNVGTEHRSTSRHLEYDEPLARRISKEVGRILSLHGTSSLVERNFAGLSESGFLKINIFTAMAVSGGQAVARHVLRHIGSLFSQAQIREMIHEGVLGDGASEGGLEGTGPRLDHLANEHRRNAWFHAVKRVCKKYFLMLNYSRYARVA